MFQCVNVNWPVLGGLMCWSEFKIDSFKLQFCPYCEVAGEQDNGSLWLEGSGHLTYSVKLRNPGPVGTCPRSPRAVPSFVVAVCQSGSIVQAPV